MSEIKSESSSESKRLRQKSKKKPIKRIEDDGNDFILSENISNFLNSKLTKTEANIKNNIKTSKECKELKSVKIKYGMAIKEIVLEKGAREEAEKALENVIKIVEDRDKKIEDLFEVKNQALDTAKMLKEEYCKLKQVVENNIEYLNNVQKENNTLKMVISKHNKETENKLEAMRTLNEFDKSELKNMKFKLEQEIEKKEKALKETEQIKIDKSKMESDIDTLKQCNTTLEDKIINIIKIKNNLITQNESMAIEIESLNGIIKEKNNLINELQSRDPLKSTEVINELEIVHENHGKLIEKYKEQLQCMEETIQKLENENEKLQQENGDKEKQITNLSEEYENTKTECSNKIEENKVKLEEKEKDLLSFIESMKSIKDECKTLNITTDKQTKLIKVLDEKLQAKRIEICELEQSNALYHETIETFKNEKENTFELIKTYEDVIKNYKIKMKEIENQHYILEHKLKSTNDNLEIESDNSLIKDKIIEDYRQSLNDLKIKIEKLVCCSKCNSNGESNRGNKSLHVWAEELICNELNPTLRSDGNELNTTLKSDGNRKRGKRKSKLN